MDIRQLNRFWGVLSIILLVAGAMAPTQVARAHPIINKDTLQSFLNDHLNLPRGVIASQQNGTYSVRFDGPPDSGVVEVYRYKTEGGSKLIEERIGRANVRADGTTGGTIRPEDPDTISFRPGDRFRPPERSLRVYNESKLPDRLVRNLLSAYRHVETVQFIEQSPSPNDFGLLLSNDQLSLQYPSRPSTSRHVASDEPNTVSERRNRRSDRTGLRDRASFDRLIHDFEWIELPLPNSKQGLMLAAEKAVGYSRFDGEVRTTHWMEFSGTVLDVSFVRLTDENPKKMLSLAVTQRNDTIRTQAFTYNAIDQSVKRHWTERDAWIRRIGPQKFLHQKIGLNATWRGDVRTVRITREGWEPTDSSIPNPSELIPRGYTVSDSTLAYLDADGRLTVRTKDSTVSQGVAQYGELPESVTPLRNDRGVALHPGFPLRNVGEGFRTLLPENIASGITFIQGLRSLRQSRLYHLDISDGNIETIWESNRLSGYVSGTEFHDERYWAMLVNPENETSTLKEFVPAGTVISR